MLKYVPYSGGLYREGQGARQEAVDTIRFGPYNILNGRDGGLNSALRGMSQANMDIVVFQETKVMGGIYTRELVGYRIVVTAVLIPHRGGVANSGNLPNNIIIPNNDVSIVARNYIFSLIWRCYGPKQDILDYWGTIIFVYYPIVFYLR